MRTWKSLLLAIVTLGSVATLSGCIVPGPGYFGPRPGYYRGGYGGWHHHGHWR